METCNKSGQATIGPGKLRRALQKHPLFFFFLMAYALSWVLLIPYVLSIWGTLPQATSYTVFFVLKGFGPTVAGIVMTGVVAGKEGLLRLRQRIRQWRIGGLWYLLILLGIPALLLLGIVVQPGTLAGFQGLTPALLVSYPLTFVAIFFGGGPLGEEIGWRGFALPRLQPRYGPLWGTLLLGVLWTFWHLPDFLTPAQGGGPGTGLATFLTNLSIFMLLVLSLAIILTWIFNHTRGSIFAALLAHAGVNTPQVALVPLFPAVGVTGLNLAALIAFGVPALLIVILTRGRLGYRPDEAQAWAPEEIETQPS